MDIASRRASSGLRHLDRPSAAAGETLSLEVGLIGDQGRLQNNEIIPNAFRTRVLELRLSDGESASLRPLDAGK